MVFRFVFFFDEAGRQGDSDSQFRQVQAVKALARCNAGAGDSTSISQHHGFAIRGKALGSYYSIPPSP